jgi:valyl-tRNA synthetase
VGEFGADAMRFTIVNITPLGQNLLLSTDKFQIGARFANKIWHASRYLLMNIGETPVGEVPEEELDTPDRWILTLYERTVAEINRLLDSYRPNEASSLAYEFFWHEFCDWYIEFSKVKLYSGDDGAKSHAASMLVRLLEGCMRLLHPFMPFITEEVWQRIPGEKDALSIMVSPYPRPAGREYPESVRVVDTLKEIVYGIRNIRGEMNVPPEMKARVLIRTSGDGVGEIVSAHRDVISFLARLESIEADPGVEKPRGSASAVGSGFEIFLPLRGLIDIDREKARLEKELQKIRADVQRSRSKLGNESFVSRAPGEVVSREKERLEEHRKNQERVERLLASLE